MPTRRLILLSAAFASVASVAFAVPEPGLAGEMTAREITEMFFKADGRGTIDLSKKDLTFLDLSDINFKGATLEGSDLHGAVLTDSNLQGANLKGTRLNLATLTRTNFTEANLEGASLLRAAFTASPDPRPRDTPVFVRANLKGARIHSRLDYTDFTGADLTGAQFGPEDPKNELLLTARTVLTGANFTGAKMSGASVPNSLLRFARFAGADLTGADFTGTDLARADLTGADVSGANFTRTNLYGTVLTGVIGLDTAKGLDQAIDYDKATR